MPFVLIFDALIVGGLLGLLGLTLTKVVKIVDNPAVKTGIVSMSVILVIVAVIIGINFIKKL
jgi:hypothetical protein